MATSISWLPDGKTILRGERLVSPEDAEQAGISLAEELLDKGAREILTAVYQGNTAI